MNNTDSDDLLEANFEITLLYDFYGELLTKKQRDFFELYYMENLSINEIAKNGNISRQAVWEQILRVKDKLVSYEAKIGYLDFYKKSMQDKHMLTEVIKWLLTISRQN